MNRRRFIRHASLAASGCLLASAAWGAEAAFPVVRTPATNRKFTSPAVEATIRRVKSAIGNQELAWMFENCFPNTLDTTVDFQMLNGRPDTYVITGDIDAMWLRDSSAQVYPYLSLLKQDPALQQLVAGVLNRQTRYILLDPYANAFYRDATKISGWKSDLTTMKPGVHERKWEVDSLCYPLRLAHGYWQATGDPAPFDDAWRSAVALIVKTFREQQRQKGPGPYHFQRRTAVQSDTLAGGGYGNPARPVGLIFSMFRPSDDATVFPFLIPSNFFAVTSLRQAAEMLEQIHQDHAAAADCRALAGEVEQALHACALVNRPSPGESSPPSPARQSAIYAYEVDAYGDSYAIDDGNLPSLLSLPYLGGVKTDDPVYQATRRFVLSSENPYYCAGKFSGPGGPHAGKNRIWPLGLVTQALTSTDDREIAACLRTLQLTHAGTGFMHESFDMNDPRKFTRPWFAWANTIFGELILTTFQTRPHLLD